MPKSTLKILYLVLKACTKNEVHNWKYLFLNWLNNLHLSHSTVIKMTTLFQLLMLIPKKLLIIFFKFFLFNPLLWIFFLILLFCSSLWKDEWYQKIKKSVFHSYFYMIKKKFLQIEEALTNLITFLLHSLRILVWFWRGLLGIKLELSTHHPM